MTVLGEVTLRHTRGSHTALLEGSLWPQVGFLGHSAAHTAGWEGQGEGIIYSVSFCGDTVPPNPIFFLNIELLFLIYLY